MLDEAVQAILNGMDRMIGDLRGELNTGFENMDAKIGQTMNELKDEIDGMKADLSDTSSRREFEELKVRVDKYHPLS